MLLEAPDGGITASRGARLGVVEGGNHTREGPLRGPTRECRKSSFLRRCSKAASADRREH